MNKKQLFKELESHMSIGYDDFLNHLCIHVDKWEELKKKYKEEQNE